MSHDLSLQEIKKEWHGSLKSYIWGFTLSLVFTLASFALTLSKIITGHTLVYTLSALALSQAVLQLLFFLHVGQEAKPRWETLTFYFMLLILVIIVLGTLWIMADLNARMMSMPEAHD